MKMHAKEIIKNKADKMVDLIIDEVGEDGDKTLTASFIDKKERVKYAISINIRAGSPEVIKDEVETGVSQDLIDRIVALENKEDIVYDDAGIKARLTVLEEKVATLEGSQQEGS